MHEVADGIGLEARERELAVLAREAAERGVHEPRGALDADRARRAHGLVDGRRRRHAVRQAIW